MLTAQAAQRALGEPATTQSFIDVLKKPAPRRLAYAALIPITIFGLVAMAGVLTMAVGDSQEKLQAHIARKQVHLWKQRTGQIPKSAPLYPRRRKASVPG